MENGKDKTSNSDLEPIDPAGHMPKQDWPIGPIEDNPLDDSEQGERLTESSQTDSNKRQDSGSEEWPSVSWP